MNLKYSHLRFAVLLAPSASADLLAGADVTPAMISELYSGPTEGWCVNAASGAAVDKFQVDGTYATDAEGPATCYALCAPFVAAPGFVGMQWRAVARYGARCICFFDDGYLPAPAALPGGAETKTDGTSVGPVVGVKVADPGQGGDDHWCYAYKGYMDAERAAVYGEAHQPLTDYLDFRVYGTVLQVAAAAERPYDQNQHTIGDLSPTFDAAAHATLSATGNAWSAYLLPQTVEVRKDTVLRFRFALEEETVAGFVAVCLDADTEETGANGRCFVLHSTQGWVAGMVNVPTQTRAGETTSHAIPVGDFFEGEVDYLVFIQDSDGADRRAGRSSVEDLELVEVDDAQLKIEINGEVEYLKNDQVSYRNKEIDNEDTKDFWMHVSEDQAGVQINGNQWKALPLNHPYNVTAHTLLEFDVVVGQSVDFHAVCLDATTSRRDALEGNECVVLQNPKDTLTKFHHLTTKVEEGVQKKIVVPFGSFWDLGDGEHTVVNYLAFIQDNDASDRHDGRSSWSNFRLYEEARMPLRIAVFGDEVTMPNVQDALQNDRGDVQDSRDHPMSISTDGKTATATSNSWKRMTLPSPVVVTPATSLRFDFALYEESELHAICLLDEVHIKDGRSDCFFTAGVQSHSNTQGARITPFTTVDEVRTYDINVGSYFTGEVKYIGFILDNDLDFTPGDAERTFGQSSWSDIEIYNLPSLNIGLDEETISVENFQISYDTNQDSTPIRDHLATIDGPSISFAGNAWRALELPSPLSPSDLGDFVLSFDFTLAEAGENHAICFDENLEFGDQDNPNNPDPRRCVSTAFYEPNPQSPLNVILTDYQTREGESHHYVLNLSKMYHRMYQPIKYIVFLQDSDADRSTGESTFSNIAITTSQISCLDDGDFSFQLSDCTVNNFLGKVADTMASKAVCTSTDPLMELFTLFGATQETDVYERIEKICSSAYKTEQYNFGDSTLGMDKATERQLVKEYIDGGTVLNYGDEADSAVMIGKVDGKYASTRVFSWPEHHALDNCDVGAAMCCFVSSRADANSEENSDLCYVDIKASRRTAHVKDGWSVYGEEKLYCEGFAWGTGFVDGSLSSALKGNALWKIGFESMYSRGHVEQVPGAPLCGCMDRMPVVTNAACTTVTSSNSVVDINYDSVSGLFDATFTAGDVEYRDCGDFGAHYKDVVGADSPDAAYIDTRIVGDGGCHSAINNFLADKGLTKTE